MKNALLAAFAVVTIGFASCSKTDAPVATTSTTDDEISSIVISTAPPFDQYVAENSYNGVSYTTDELQNSSNGNASMMHGHHDKKNLSSIIRCLDLTADQKAQVDGFLKSSRDCMQTAQATFFNSFKELNNQYRESVKTIRDAVKGGSMTKDDARAELQKLGKSFRTALEDAQKLMMAAAKDCQTALFNNIKSILTPDQLAKWTEWETTGKSPCHH